MVSLYETFHIRAHITCSTCTSLINKCNAFQFKRCYKRTTNKMRWGYLQFCISLPPFTGFCFCGLSTCTLFLDVYINLMIDTIGEWDWFWSITNEHFWKLFYIVVHMILWSIASCNESRNECIGDEGGKEFINTNIEKLPIR